MRRLRKAGFWMVWMLAVGGMPVRPAAAARTQTRPPLFVYLHVLQPLETQAEAAREAGDEAEANRLTLRSLRGYQALDQEAGTWQRIRPYGLQDLVREGLARTAAAVEELRAAAAAEDAMLRRLNQPVNVDVEAMHIREVAKLLTALTDVNVVVDDTLFSQPGSNPKVTLRVDREVPLLQVIRLIVQRKGLAYAIEEDYVYISTRTGIDGGAGFSNTAWFRPE